MRRELATILFGLVLSGCGGKSTKLVGDRPTPPEFPVPPSPPFACDGEPSSFPRLAARRRTLATGPDLRFESVSSDGALVAYTRVSPGVPGPDGMVPRDLFVVGASGGEPFPVAGALLEKPGEADLVVRFEGRTLLVFSGVLRDLAQGLSVWRPGDDALTPVAKDVDPTAVRSSRDGRFLSIEANDRRGDGIDTVDVLLLEVSTPATTLVASLDRARARFTRDSAYLVYSGYTGDGNCPVRMQRRALADGTEDFAACKTTFSRWEISRDGEWLVHSDTWGPPDPETACPHQLLRTSLSNGAQQVLADCALDASGKELDVGRTGDTVSFLARSSEPSTGGAALLTVPLEGGEPLELVPSNVVSIVEHLAGAVVFTTVSEPVEGGECGDDRFAIVPEAGGPAHDLGRATSWCADPPTPDEGTVAELDGSVLALGTDGELRYQPHAAEPPILVGCGIAQASLVDARRVLFSGSLGEGPGLFLYDAETGAISEVEPSIAGRFGGGPDLGRAYVAVTPEGDAFSGVRGSF